MDEKFKTAGVQPKTYVMDNECSNELNQALQKDKYWITIGATTHT